MAFIVQTRKFIPDHQVSLLPQLNLFKVFQGDVASLKPIVYIVVIVSNLISQIDNLTFQSRPFFRVIGIDRRFPRLIIIR